LVALSARKYVTISLSSREFEYMAVTNATQLSLSRYKLFLLNLKFLRRVPQFSRVTISEQLIFLELYFSCVHKTRWGRFSFYAGTGCSKVASNLVHQLQGGHIHQVSLALPLFQACKSNLNLYGPVEVEEDGELYSLCGI
jgi:hypothetical protein